MSAKISNLDAEISIYEVKSACEMLRKEGAKTKADLFNLQNFIRGTNSNVEVLEEYFNEINNAEESLKQIEKKVFELVKKKDDLKKEANTVERRLIYQGKKKFFMIPVYYFCSLIFFKAWNFFYSNILLTQVDKQLKNCKNSSNNSFVTLYVCYIFTKICSLFM